MSSKHLPAHAKRVLPHLLRKVRINAQYPLDKQTNKQTLGQTFSGPPHRTSNPSTKGCNVHQCAITLGHPDKHYDRLLVAPHTPYPELRLQPLDTPIQNSG
jgi:hypothetical protein